MNETTAKPPRPIHVIAMIGPARAGKTTVATRIQTEYGYNRFRFADTLKNMLAKLGLSKEHIDGACKETPLDLLCGCTTRYAMQTLGTEWRNMIGKELWSIQTAHAIEKAAADPDAASPFLVVIDDMRFPHEASILTEKGFKVTTVRVWNDTQHYPYIRMWLARRPLGRFLMKLIPALYLHESEAWWATLPADIEINNTGSLDDLYTNVSQAIGFASRTDLPVGGTRVLVKRSMEQANV